MYFKLQNIKLEKENWYNLKMNFYFIFNKLLYLYGVLLLTDHFRYFLSKDNNYVIYLSIKYINLSNLLWPFIFEFVLDNIRNLIKR